MSTTTSTSLVSGPPVQNTFHMVEGEKATVEAYKKATATADTHVVFVGHATQDAQTHQTQGISLDNVESYGNNGSHTMDFKEGPTGLELHETISVGDQVSASSVALFSCDSYNLASQYDTTDFTGVQSGPDGTALGALDLGAAAWVTAGGGQAGDAAANAVIEKSHFQSDTGDNVASERPKRKPD